MLNENPMQCRILLVDDHWVVRAGIDAVISEEPAMRICGECSDGQEAVVATKALQPDLVILDLMLGKDSALPFIGQIIAAKPDVRVLVLSMHDELTFAPRAIKAGAHGYVMKGADMRELLKALQEVSAGRLYVSDVMRSEMLEDIAQGRGERISGLPSNISSTELKVLQMIGSGHSLREIASVMGRSLRTAETHRNNVRLKLGLPNSAALVHFATQWVNAQGHSGATTLTSNSFSALSMRNV